MASSESDGALLARAQAGDGDAFEALFARHRRGVRAYAAAILRDAALAEDVVQEAFVALAREVASLDPRRGVTGWLYRVARNRAIDLSRRRAGELTAGEAVVTAAREDEGLAASAAEDLTARERDEELAALLAAVPAAEREVLALHFYGGLAYREVADVVKAPLGTVLWRAQRGLGRLRQAMKSGAR